MQHNWYRTSWCHKITALGIITSYFLLLIFIHDTTYIWATLALIFVLFVTTFSCASNDSLLLLQLRGTRVTGITNRTVAQEYNEENQGEIQSETRIWMTDIPPSYSFVMADLPPQTPPPSYGSAILMFPPPYGAIETKAQDPIEGAEDQELRRPLSISTQVSVSSVMPETAQLEGITFSAQVSVISSQSEITPDLALRTRFFISRQVSREDGGEDNTTNNNTAIPEKVLSETSTRLFLLSRQSSREDCSEEGENSRQDYGNRRAIVAFSRQASREDRTEGIDSHKQMIKYDLRRRVLLSRQASRDPDSSKDILVHEDLDNECSLSTQQAIEDVANNSDQKKGEGRTLLVLSRQCSVDATGSSENQRSEQAVNDRAIAIEASGSTVSITIPEDLDTNNKDL